MTNQANDGPTPAASRPKRRRGTMSYPTTRFKSMSMALRELERFIKSGAQIETGKPLKQFGNLRPSELVANWMICAVANAEAQLTPLQNGSQIRSRKHAVGNRLPAI
jgi:hypothetical protein